MDNSALSQLAAQIEAAYLPADVAERVRGIIESLRLSQSSANYLLEFQKNSTYIKWLLALPWQASSADSLDLQHIKEVLDANHYGLSEVKNRILEYVSVMVLKKQQKNATSFSHAPILSLVGLVGSGKTSIAYSIAQALGRKIVRIPFGGLGSAAMLRGQSHLLLDSEPGALIKALVVAKVKNPVILLDEIDRVSEQNRAEVMGVLLELLDPEQNHAFVDHYIDYPFDLSEVFFITTSNNTKDIANAVLDRLEIIQMPSYTDAEKIAIAASYMLPKSLAEAAMNASQLVIDDAVWAYIVRPLGFDPGIRSLKRTIDGIVRKVARVIIENKGTVTLPIHITVDNLKEYVEQW